MINTTITIGNILEIIAIAIGGLSFLFTMKTSIGKLANDIGTMQTDFTDMKTEIKKLGDVIIRMAVYDQRLANLEQDVRELRHGHGFVQGVTREYP